MDVLYQNTEKVNVLVVDIFYRMDFSRILVGNRIFRVINAKCLIIIIITMLKYEQFISLTTKH